MKETMSFFMKRFTRSFVKITFCLIVKHQDKYSKRAQMNMCTEIDTKHSLKSSAWCYRIISP